LMQLPGGVVHPFSKWFTQTNRPQPGSSSVVNQLVCGEFHPEQRGVYPFLSLLPAFMHIPNTEGQALAWLQSVLRFMTEEADHPRPGAEAVVSRMMGIIFIMSIRHWLQNRASEEGGWVKALYHPEIGPVLSQMHQHPEHPWTVDSLALTVGMSRSRLTAQFSSLVGETPMKYLTRWRMQLAAMLIRDDPTVKLEVIARSVGYASSFAFSKAFKRITGIAPNDYRVQMLSERRSQSRPVKIFRETE
jgi:AraC-like DNA-binding protein